MPAIADTAPIRGGLEAQLREIAQHGPSRQIQTVLAGCEIGNRDWSALRADDEDIRACPPRQAGRIGTRDQNIRACPPLTCRRKPAHARERNAQNCDPGIALGCGGHDHLSADDIGRQGCHIVQTCQGSVKNSVQPDQPAIWCQGKQRHPVIAPACKNQIQRSVRGRYGDTRQGLHTRKGRAACVDDMLGRAIPLRACPQNRQGRPPCSGDDNSRARASAKGHDPCRCHDPQIRCGQCCAACRRDDPQPCFGRADHQHITACLRHACRVLPCGQSRKARGGICAHQRPKPQEFLIARSDFGPGCVETDQAAIAEAAIGIEAFAPKRRVAQTVKGNHLASERGKHDMVLRRAYPCRGKADPVERGHLARRQEPPCAHAALLAGTCHQYGAARRILPDCRRV